MSPDPSRNLRTLIEHEERRARSPRRRRLQFLSLVLPLGMSLALLTLAVVFRGFGFLGEILGMAVLIFTALGKFAIWLGISGKESMGVWEIALLVVYMDVTIASLLVYNLPRIYRIKGIGEQLEALAEHGHYMLETKPWLGRVTFFGVIAFVMFPLTGTGAIGGSIFGRLLGLGAKRTLGGIALGAVMGSFCMAYFAESLSEIFTPEVRDSWQFKVIGIAALVAVFAFLWVRGKRVAREIQARKASRNGAVPASETP